MLTTILLVFALVLEILATAGVPSPPRFNLMAGGLAFFLAALLFGNLHLMH